MYSEKGRGIISCARGNMKAKVTPPTLATASDILNQGGQEETFCFNAELLELLFSHFNPELRHVKNMRDYPIERGVSNCAIYLQLL